MTSKTKKRKSSGEGHWDNLDPNAAVQVIDLTKTYKMGEIDVHALRGVSFNVQRGEFVSIMGPSGSGKTTLLNMIGALDNPSGGAVFVDGINVAQMNDEAQTDLRLRRIGFIFQFYNLIPVLNALENVELPLVFQNLPKKKFRKQRRNIEAILEQVGLKDRAKHLPSELSGGEQQRVAIARSLCNGPALLIADEPTGELDTKKGSEIVNLLKTFNEKMHQTILMVTHDPAIGRLADRMLRMRDGKIVEEIPLRPPKSA